MQGKNERLRMRRERGTFLKRCLALRTENADIKKIFPGDNCKEWGAFWERAFHGSLASFGARRFPKRRAKSPLVRPQTHTRCPGRGLTRRLRRGLGLTAPWGAHTFLSMAKEKCAKESQRHGTTGKRLLLPILTAGLAMSRAMELDSYHLLLESARARLFPPSKWAGLFPCVA